MAGPDKNEVKLHRLSIINEHPKGIRKNDEKRKD